MASTSVSGSRRRHVDGLDRHADRVRAAPAAGPAAARDVDQHPAHHPGRHAEEVLPVLPADLVPAEQPQAQLVDEPGRLQADGRPLAREVAGRHAMQLVVDERNHPLEGLGVTLAPGPEQPGDLGEVRAFGWSSHADDRRQSSRAPFPGRRGRPGGNRVYGLDPHVHQGAGPAEILQRVLRQPSPDRPAGFAGCRRLDHRGRFSPGPCEVRVKTSPLLVAACLLLSSTLFVRASPGARSAARRRRARRARLRRRTVRRGPPRAARLPRSQPGRPGRQRPRVRRLPHAHGQLPALAGERGSTIQAPAVAAPVESRCRRSAVPADRRRRLPDQRRQRPRLQQPAPERPGPDHLPAAAQHAADRSGHQRCRRTRRSSMCGEARRPSTTSR